jgi:RNA polymerase sigma-70 factor (sigma-E family)
VRNPEGSGGVNTGVHADDEVVSPSARARPASPSGTFDDLYRAEYPRAVRLARLLTGSPSSAEDLAQEAFVRVHRRGAGVANPPAYLRTVVVNVCRNWHRARAREARRLVEHGQLIDVSVEARELEASLALLSYRQRSVLVLRYWLDLSEAEIATALGCRAGTVKSLHARALAALRKELPDEH